MKNLKKVLALVLVVATLMTMTTLASAAFTDANSIEYTEAVDVLTGIGVINGYTDNSFRPEANVTRAQMAKMVTYIVASGEDVGDLYAGANTFSDCSTHWAKGYIAYANKTGIVAGVGNGKFNPDGSVTGTQAAKMMLCALGYDSDAEGYTGTNWSVNVLSDAKSAGLLDGLNGVNMSAAMTREQAAQLMFNALKADMVEYDRGNINIDSGDTSITIGGSAAKKVENNVTDTKDTYNGEADKVTQLCEEYFPKLKVSDTPDDFQRPGNTWKFDGDKIAFGMEEALATYAGADFDKDVVDDLVDDEYTFGKTYYNGAEIDKDYTNFEKTNGVTVELYADDNDEITVVVTEAYVAQMTTVNTDDDDAISDVVVTVYEAGRAISKKGDYTMPIDAKSDEAAFDLVKGYEEDEYFMVFLKPGWDADDKAAGDLLAVADVETVDGKVTSKSADATYNGWIKIDGTKYEFANEYSQEDVVVNSEGTFYLYNGYVVHFDGSTAASTDYLYVTRADEKTGDWGAKSYYAEVVYTDGTCEVIDTDKEYAAGVYSYEYDEDEAYYVLAAKDTTGAAATIEKGKTAVVSGVTADSQTVYVSITTKGTNEFDKASVYTGYKNVVSMTGGKAYIVKDGTVADYVFVVDGTTTASSDDLIYIAGDSVSALVDDSDLGEYYTYNAVVDGEITEIMVAKSAGDKLDGLYASYKVDEDGIYSSLTPATSGDGEDYLTTSGDFKKASNDVITVGDAGTMAYADDVVVYVIDTDGSIASGSVSRNYSDVSIDYTVNDDGAVTSLYIEK